MNGKLIYNISLALGGLSLLLLVTNIALISSNRSLQESANQRQAEINKGSSLTSISRGLVQALAEAAGNNNDTAIKELLAAQGLTLTAAKNSTVNPK